MINLVSDNKQVQIALLIVLALIVSAGLVLGLPDEAYAAVRTR